MSEVMSSSQVLPSQPWSEQLGSGSQSSAPIVPEQEAYREDSPMTDQPAAEQADAHRTNLDDDDQDMSGRNNDTTSTAQAQLNNDNDHDEVMSPPPDVEDDAPEEMGSNLPSESPPPPPPPPPESGTVQNQASETDEPMTAVPEQDDTSGNPQEGESLPPPPPPPPPPAPTDIPEPPKDISPWMDIPEVNAEPYEEERTWMANNEPNSALDNSHWQSKAFTTSGDPELVAGNPSTIQWVVEKYNGTQEDPNRELIMYSPSVSLGGYSWRLKLYPKGNKTSYMSLYLECESLDSRNEKSKEPKERKELLYAPIPAVGKPLKRPRRVPVEFVLIAYNPQEPQAWYYREASHAFSRSSPDHGFSRFGGVTIPELGTRLRYHKAPLLSSDKLGFICHMRAIQDPTNTLFSNSAELSWAERFAKTGLNEVTGGHMPGNGRGQLAVALATWFMLPPFRRIIYSIPERNSAKNPDLRPTPLVEAFQSIFRVFRTRTDPLLAGPSVGLISTALGKHCTCIPEYADVKRTWEILFDILEKELTGTDQRDHLVALFGASTSPSTPEVFRWDTQKSDTSSKLKLSLDSTKAKEADSSKVICTVEVPRRQFQAQKWILKDNDLDALESFTLGDSIYQLFGVITHGKVEMFSAFLRPDGKNWYKYGCLQDRNYFPSRLTQRQALQAYKASASLLLYIRQDIWDRDVIINTEAFRGAPEHDFEGLLKPVLGIEMTEEQTSPDMDESTTPEGGSSADTIVNTHATDSSNPTSKDTPVPKHVDITVFTQSFFTALSNTPGTIDVFQYHRPTLTEVGQVIKSRHTYDIRMQYDCSLEDVKTTLMKEIQSVECKEQLVLRPIDAFHDFSALRSWARTISACKAPPPEAEKYFERLSRLYPGHRLWLHILEVKEIPTPEAPSAQVLESGVTADEDVTMFDVGAGLPATIDNSSQQVDNNSHDSQSSDAQPSNNNSQAEDSADTSMTSSEDSVSSPPAEELKKFDSDIFVFLKLFLPKRQKLMNICVIKAAVKSNVQETALAALTKRSEVCEELRQQNINISQLDVSANTVTIIHESENQFLQSTLSNYTLFEALSDGEGSVIVLVPTLSQKEKHEIEIQGGLPEFDDFLLYLRKQINHPRSLASIQTHAYFGEDYHHGAFSKGRYHGPGKHIYSHGDQFDGDFVMGKREGKGKLTQSNGDTYEGDWLSDKMHGEGVLTETATGNVYTGGFRDGRKFGAGVTKWAHAEDASKLCAICYEQDIDCAFYDCGHVCACAECAAQLDNCPVCRKAIIKVMKIYFRSYI